MNLKMLLISLLLVVLTGCQTTRSSSNHILSSNLIPKEAILICKALKGTQVKIPREHKDYIFQNFSQSQIDAYRKNPQLRKDLRDYLQEKYNIRGCLT